MFDIKKEDVTGTTNRLLFNIWQELKKPEQPQEVKPTDKPKPAKRKPAKKKTIKKDGGKNG
jgi:hypothetical protein